MIENLWLILNNLPQKHRAPLRIAVRKALASSHRRHKMGASIFFGGVFLGAGANSKKTHPFARNAWKILHAEESAILAAKDVPFGATIYVVRISRSGTLEMAKPCPNCQKLLALWEFKQIVYSGPGNTFISEELGAA